MNPINYALGWKNIFIVSGVAILLTFLPGQYTNLGAVILFVLLLVFIVTEAQNYSKTGTFYTRSTTQ